MDIETKIRDAFQDGDDTVKDRALEAALSEIESLRAVVSDAVVLLDSIMPEAKRRPMWSAAATYFIEQNKPRRVAEQSLNPQQPPSWEAAHGWDEHD